MKSAACPSCAAPMEQRFFERKPHGKVELDMCFTCHAIWFDQYESATLMPGAVLELFRVIHNHHDQPPRPLGDALACPGCRARLALTHDIQRTNRIAYHRCPNAHGRLTTFFQFLREKNFVRDLTRPEIEQLRATVKQVRCSSCGAPVNLGRDPACGYCRAPISILDADAVRKTIADLDAADRGRHIGDPQAIVDGLLAGKRSGRLDGPVDPQAALDAVLANHRTARKGARPAAAGADATASTWGAGAGGGSFLDLVSDALDFLATD